MTASHEELVELQQKFAKPPPRRQAVIEEAMEVRPWKFSPHGKPEARDRYGKNLADLSNMVVEAKDSQILVRTMLRLSHQLAHNHDNFFSRRFGSRNAAWWSHRTDPC